jgi:hypothetical protein
VPFQSKPQDSKKRFSQSQHPTSFARPGVGVLSVW